jgi:hypothetical protein
MGILYSLSHVIDIGSDILKMGARTDKLNISKVIGNICFFCCLSYPDVPSGIEVLHVVLLSGREC